MARQIDRGVTFDDQTGDWTIWMTFPKALEQDVQKKVYSGRLKDWCEVETTTVRNNRKMLKCSGKYRGSSWELRSTLIQLRKDFTQYVKKLIEQQENNRDY